MFKSKALFVVAILVIALAVIASSCAPAAPAATPAAPAATPAAPAPAAPAATPAAPAAAPAAPAGTHTWGDSATYTNDAVGFTVQYPAKWKTETPTAPTSVAQVSPDPSNATGDRIYVDVIPAASDLNAVAANLLNTSAAFQQYKVTAKTTSTAPFTLAGSVTSAVASENTAKIVIYNFYFYAISATKGDKTVNVMGQTIGGGTAKKQIQEICQSLSFK